MDSAFPPFCLFFSLFRDVLTLGSSRSPPQDVSSVTFRFSKDGPEVTPFRYRTKSFYVKCWRILVLYRSPTESSSLMGRTDAEERPAISDCAMRKKSRAEKAGLRKIRIAIVVELPRCFALN